MILDRVTRRKENHNFLLQVLLQKRKQEQKPLLARDDAVPLLDARGGGHRARVVNADVNRTLQRQARQIFNLCGLRRAKQHRLPLLWQHFHDGSHLLLEPDIEHAIGFVHDKHLERAKRESTSVLHVIQQPSRRGDEQVDALDQAFGFGASIRASDD